MAGSIKGITLEIGGDTTKLNQALKESRSESRNLQSELKQVNTALKLDPGNIDMIRQKETLLTREIENQKAKLVSLKAAKEQADKAAESGTEVNEEGYRALEREIVKTQAAINKCTSELGRFGDESEDVKKAGENFSTVGEKVSAVGAKFKTVGSGLATVGKVVGSTLAVAGAAAGKLIKESISAAGELEQNMGGSEAVFKEYAESMQQTAAEAYSKMGLSQSDYLATANKMGALFQGSGFSVEESAEMSQEAMQAAADVASIMGIDVTSAMEAVAGAAKGNFTMMDNLGVAMNDTTLKAYAQEKGLGKLETTHDKVAAAMQMFSEKAAYAAGNYEKENETIAGSLTTLKASFNNFMSGTGNPSQLADSISNFGNVIIKNIKTILPTMIQGITSVLAQLGPQLGPMINELLPVIIDGIQMLVQSAVTVLPGLLEAVLPSLGTAFSSVLVSLIEALPDLTSALASGLGQAVSAIITQLPEILGALVTAIPAALVSLFDVFNSTTATATDEQKAMKAAIEENGTAVDELTSKMEDINGEYETAVDNAKNSAESTLAEIEAKKNLGAELEELIDSNGKVKEGYEERVDYILGEMNSAFDTELQRTGEIITKNGEIVNSYNDIKNAIEANAEASMAAAIMKQYEEEYAAAVKANAEAMKAASEATKTLGTAQQTRQDMIDSAIAKMEEYGHTATTTAEAIQALNDGWVGGIDPTTEEFTTIQFDAETWSEINSQIQESQGVIQDYIGTQQELAEIEDVVNSARVASAEGNNQKIVDSYALTESEIQNITQGNTDSLLSDMQSRASGIESIINQITTALANGDTATAQSLYSILETSVSNLQTLETEYKNAGGNAPTGFVAELEARQGAMATAIKKAVQSAMNAWKTEGSPWKWQQLASNSISGLMTPFDTAASQLYNKGFTLATQFRAGYKAGDRQNSPSKAMMKCGGYTVEGLMQGINPGITLAEKAGFDTATAYRDGYTNTLDIHSPSKEMQKVGADTTQGLLNGLDEHTREIIKLAEDTGEEELELTKFYNSEKQRLEDEEYDKEYNEKISNAKDAAEVEKIKQEYIQKAQEEGQDAYLDTLKKAAEYEEEQYKEKTKAAETFVSNMEKIFDNFKKIFSTESSSLTQTYTLKNKNGDKEEWTVLKDFGAEGEKVSTYAGKLYSLQKILPDDMFDVLEGMKMSEGGTVADILLGLSQSELADFVGGWNRYNSIATESAGALTRPFLEEADDSYKVAALSESALAKWATGTNATASGATAYGGIAVENNFYTTPMSPAEVATEMTSALKREALLV